MNTCLHCGAEGDDYPAGGSPTYCPANGDGPHLWSEPRIQVTFTVTFTVPAGTTRDDVRSILTDAYVQIEDARNDDVALDVQNILESVTTDGETWAL